MQIETRRKIQDYKVITVLFTRHYNIFSNFIYHISGGGYTHTSISLEDDNDFFYSFNFKGFRKEYPNKSKAKTGKSVGYKFKISNEGFKKIKIRIEEMEKNKDSFCYSKIGVVLCLLGIPLKIKNRYFCSQFVSEMLILSGSIKLNKSATLYLPNHLLKELYNQKCLKEILLNPY